MTDNITVELTETECIAVQHALVTVCNWNYNEDDPYLERWHNAIRVKFIDAQEEWLANGDR